MAKKVLTRLKGGEINDWVLNGNSVWIDVDDLVVYIVKTDEGIAVDIYPKDDVESEEPIASTWALFNEGS